MQSLLKVELAKIPSYFHPSSKVWIFQADRIITPQEQNEINNLLIPFCTQWKSHKDDVKGWASILFNQFIVFIADETQVQVSGCSTDGIMRLVKEIEHKFSLSMLDRLRIAIFKNNQIELIFLNRLIKLIENDEIKIDTLFFNNSITTLHDLHTQWLIPIQTSWMMKQIEKHQV